METCFGKAEKMERKNTIKKKWSKLASLLVTVVKVDLPFNTITSATTIHTHFMNTLKYELTTCLKNKLLNACNSFILLSKLQEIVLNMKPVHNCTGFIFCTFHAFLHLKLNMTFTISLVSVLNICGYCTA